MRHVVGYFQKRPPQVVKVQQHSGAVPCPYTGIPGNRARNHTNGIQTPQAIKEAKCRVVFTAAAAFCSLLAPINGHRLTFQTTEEEDIDLLVCGGARPGQMEVA